MALTDPDGIEVKKGVPTLVTDDETLDLLLINPTHHKVSIFLGDVVVDAQSAGGIPLRQDVGFARNDTGNTPALQGKITAVCETATVYLSLTTAE